MHIKPALLPLLSALATMGQGLGPLGIMAPVPILEEDLHQKVLNVTDIPATARRRSCMPTSNKSLCTLSIYSGGPIIENDLDRIVGVWDHSCNFLGGLQDVGAIGAVGTWTVMSQLPWTVELTLTSKITLQPQGYFWYAGRKTELADGYYYNCDDEYPWTECYRTYFKCD